MVNNKFNKSPGDESAAPLLGSWKKLYFLVFSTLVILIIIFYFFTRTFE
ncbi:MAG: hypothetical protein PVF17_12485 [Ignavibacteria bacterium]